MNNAINQSWTDGRLYEVTFTSEVNDRLFSRMCVINIDKSETELLNWFGDNLTQIKNIDINYLGDVWIENNRIQLV
ncbi:hypothetical protein IGI86_002650 [Enterococcus sp. AZ188]|uniref:hypothetical protein n=1 Tax=Enterococcus sp. AZ188 TaxID=2774678 RepID=UPI003D30132D